MVRTTATWACSGVLTLASRAATTDSSVSMSRGGGREGLVLAGTGSERRHTGSSRGGRTGGGARSVPREARQGGRGRQAAGAAGRRHTVASRGGRTVGAPRSVPREDRQRATDLQLVGVVLERPPAGSRRELASGGGLWNGPPPGPAASPR